MQWCRILPNTTRNVKGLPQHAMKAHVVQTYRLPIFNLSTRWRWVISFTFRPLYPLTINPGTHWIRGWVGPRASVKALEKRWISCPCQNHDSLEIQQSLYWLHYPWHTVKCKPHYSWLSFLHISPTQVYCVSIANTQS